MVRQRVISHFFGQATEAADALNAAFRIPNFLQNLFGEGALSASLIPEYSRLRAQGREEDARRLAGAVAGLLATAITILVAIGVLATPLIVGLLAPGFHGTRRALAIILVRIMFPGVGLLVMSAWCLGILNSHRRFFLSYAAPVGWNVAIIAATWLGATRVSGNDLVVWTAWGAAIGGLVQLLVQLPPVWRLTGGVPISLGRGEPAVTVVVRNFLPAAVSRGVVQISAFLDGVIASWLPLGAVTAITNAQLLYTLPVSLFGMSVAAAELPALSETAGRGTESERAKALRRRLDEASRQVAFFIVPSAVAFFALGRVIAALILQSGRFTAADSRWVWGTLAGSTVGLLAATLGRLYTSAHYALSDTRTPLRWAAVRVTLTVVLGLVAALYLPGALGLDPKWGTAGLSASAGVAGWIEFLLLRRSITAKIGPLATHWPELARLWIAALVGAGIGWIPLLTLPGIWPVWILALLLYGVCYLAMTAVLGVPTLAALRSQLVRRR